MKWMYVFALVLFVSCKQEKKDMEVRVAGMNKKTVPLSRKDSLLLEEQDRHSLWMKQTYYELRTKGYSGKKAWVFIDSITRILYKGITPNWYPRLRQESDSLMKERNKYKRVRLV